MSTSQVTWVVKEEISLPVARKAKFGFSIAIFDVLKFLFQFFNLFGQ